MGSFRSARLSVSANLMAKPIRVYTKTNRPAYPGALVGVRLQLDEFTAIDEWLNKQDDQPSRPEAIRRLLKKGLAS